MNETVKKKNSLSAIKTQAPTMLRPTAEGKARSEEEKPKRTREYKQKGRTGRPPKKAGEKENNRIAVCFNDAELAKIKELAGLVPLGTFLKHHLKETKLID